MSNNHNTPENDDLLQQHIDALRDEPADEGPSPQTIAATLQMLRASRTSAPEAKPNRFAVSRGFSQRLVTMTLTQRIAAAVTITLGGLVIYFTFMLFSSMGSSVAFADVVQKIKSAHTLTCTGTATFPGRPAVAMKILLSDPDRMRTEAPGGMVSIIAGRRVLIILNDKTHTATRMEVTGERPATAPAAGPISIVDAFRKIDDAKGEPIGDKTIDGVAVTGFRTKLYDRSATVWAAKKDADPVRIEMAVSVGAGDAQMVFDHIEIDPPLDESLFSTDAPRRVTPWSPKQSRSPRSASSEMRWQRFWATMQICRTAHFPRACQIGLALPRPMPKARSSIRKRNTTSQCGSKRSAA